jgi:hypothetical protein
MSYEMRDAPKGCAIPLTSKKRGPYTKTAARANSAAVNRLLGDLPEAAAGYERNRRNSPRFGEELLLGQISIDLTRDTRGNRAANRTSSGQKDDNDEFLVPHIVE